MYRFVDLGGEPTTTPKEFPKPEGLKAMLELDLEMEKGDVENYMEHARMAEELGLIELQLPLEDMAADEAGLGRELRRHGGRYEAGDGKLALPWGGFIGMAMKI